MRSARATLTALVLASCTSPGPPADAPTAKKNAGGALLTGAAALGDWTTDAPGVRRRITVGDLPRPFETPSADNGPNIVARPRDAWPRVPPGFRVELFAQALSNPRMMRTAPNGDLFVVESRPGRVRVLRAGKPAETYAVDFKQPFGIGFYPPGPDPRWIYVANTDSVVRFPYVNGDVVSREPPEVVTDDISGGGRLRGGGHWTRDLVFSLDGKKMWISVGSRSNNEDSERESQRARIFQMTPEGKNVRVYASGIRNAVGLAVHPDTGELWASVNERDELGDQLVPDYVTRVREGGFYGWPWFYIGAHEDPAHTGKHPELARTITVPDVLLQSHSASLGMTFYDGAAFPAEYRKSAFAAEHGSWNRTRRTGYKVIVVPIDAGVPRGEYVDFMTGFVTPEGDVWGRPVAVAVGRDGALYVSDDAGDCVWRVTWVGRSR